MAYPLQECKNKISSEIKKAIPKYTGQIRLEKPPEDKGDFAFPCFSLASILKKSPTKIAEEIATTIEKNKWITNIETNGGYINFYLDIPHLISETLDLIFSMHKTYGHLEKKNKKIIIEHTSSNPNGPLHVGRARNPIIGDTLVRIYKASGYDIESQFYLDDMGKQVAILAWGINNIDPKKIPKTHNEKSDHKSVGFYQEANILMEKDETIAAEIGEIIKKLEHGETNTIEMVHKAYAPVLQGINESLDRINIHIDTYIPESNFVKDKSVEKVISSLKKMPYCHEENGAYYLDLESFGIQGRTTKFYIVRKDGTTLYATRDIAYHQWKAQQADILINILGEDHKLESKQVDIALTLLDTTIRPQPVFYSFVSLPEGKMSTRKARVVYLDELIDECIERAYIEVKKRRGKELNEQQMRHIAKCIGIGALRYNIIKVQPEKDITFTWEDALNFEGNAIPFIQYAHARACSILSKIKDIKQDFFPETITHQSEILLIKQLATYPLIIEEASTQYKPHIIANYLYETASKFNQFYRDCPVIAEQNKTIQQSRIALVQATKIVLYNALELLGISAPEEM